MALYYAILRIWLAVGDGDAWVRLLSVLFAVATVPVVFLLGRAVAGRGVGALAATLFAISAFVVQYAQEARSYTLTMLLVSICLLGAVHAFRTADRRAWLVVVAGSGLAVYAHMFAGLTVLALGIAAIVAARGRQHPRGMVRPFVAIAVLALPLVAVIVLRQGGQLAWVEPTSLASIGDAAAILLGAGVRTDGETAASWALVAVLGALIVGGMVPRRTATTEEDSAWRLLVFAIVVPLATGLLVSFVKPVFVPRFFAIVVPPAVVLASVGIWRLRLSLRVAALVLVGVLAIQGLRSWYFDYAKTDWRSAVAYVASEARPGDLYVVYEEWNHRAISYYAEQAKAEPFPTRLWRGLGASDPDAYATALNGLLEREAAPGATVWLILASATRGRADPGEPRFAPLHERYGAGGPLLRLDGLSIVRFSPPSETP